MKIFGWKSTGRSFARPAKTRVSLARAFGGHSLGEWPRSYEAQVREGYLHNAIAQRAVRLVAEGVASAPLTSSDVAALALVKATSGGQALIETVAAHLLLHGNAYVEMLPGPDGAPQELYALRPERVSVEADPRGWPVAFVYKAGDAATRMPADQIIHIRTMHPLDDHYGLGCLGAASGAVAIHNAAAKWNKALLDNAARPSGALVYEPGEGSVLSAEQHDRLKTELAASFQGAGNAGRPMLLEGGLRWQAMSMSPADMDFIGLKESAAREIALAFGVPPVLLGLPGDATYSNYREANRALWAQAILPLAGKILEALSEGLRPWFTDLSLGVDLDAIPALSEDRERLWAQVNAAEFLTAEEKRAAVGLEPAKLIPPANDKPNKTGTVELKFNPWHDTENGKFTFGGQGQRFANGGSGFGGGGASGSWSKPKPKTPSAKPAPKPRVVVTPPPRPAVKQPSVASPSKPRPTKVRVLEPPSAPPKADPEKVKPLGAPLPVRSPDASGISMGVGAALAAVAAVPKMAVSSATGAGYNFDIDAVSRPSKIAGQLRIEPSQRRSRTAQNNAGKPDRQPTDHGGHFIAREFGGPEIAANHFAQDAKINRSEYRKLELKWKKALKNGQKVDVDIVPNYKGNSKRPHSVDVKYTIDGEAFIKTVSNLKKGK